MNNNYKGAVMNNSVTNENEKNDANFTLENTYKDPNSMSYKFRAKRFANVRPLIEKILNEKGECRICDIGGTEYYWEIFGDFGNDSRLKIDLFNLEKVEVTNKNYKSYAADATDMSEIDDNSYDFVHSNSVVEHVGNWWQMKKMANNVRRIAPSYFVQTPNFWFPLEPHFRFIGFQFLPLQLRAFVLNNFNVGFCGKIDSYDEALGHIDYVQLLDTKQMQILFPDAQIKHEKFIGLNKSIMAYKS